MAAESCDRNGEEYNVIFTHLGNSVWEVRKMAFSNVYQIPIKLCVYCGQMNTWQGTKTRF
jgi:hypothetical protein